jgi:hypothetical protein
MRLLQTQIEYMFGLMARSHEQLDECWWQQRVD